MKRKLVINKLEVIGFFGYFLFLGVERILALILSTFQGGSLSLTAGWFFPIVTYVISALALIGGIILFAKPGKEMLKTLFKKEEYDLNKDLTKIVIASSIYLFGGMVHTGFTLSALQFVSYGFLIMALIAKCVDHCKDNGNKYISITSLIYIVCFSMALPVCYALPQDTGLVLSIPFYISEFGGIFVLVPMFGLMMLEYFETGVHKFYISPVVAVTIFSGVAIVLRWDYEVNWFLLIALGTTILVFLALGIAARIKLKKQNN